MQCMLGVTKTQLKYLSNVAGSLMILWLKSEAALKATERKVIKDKEKSDNENIDSDYILKTLLPLIDDLDIPMIITTKTSEKIVYESININFEFF